MEDELNERGDGLLMVKKRLVLGGLTALLLGGCANYFSQYKTVYRIETTDGQRYYTNSTPSLDKKKAVYKIRDLDDNQYQIKQARIYKIEKYKHKK